MMTEKIKLKPCPFCGGKAVFVKSGASAWIRCSDCGCVYPDDAGGNSRQRKANNGTG